MEEPKIIYLLEVDTPLWDAIKDNLPAQEQFRSAIMDVRSQVIEKLTSKTGK